MKTKFYLTENGNILNIERGCFQTAGGQFLRRVFQEEMEYLVEVLTPIDFPDGIKEPDEPDIWKYLWEVELTDSSNYNPDRCFNGGSYFYVKTSMFFTRLNKGKEEFCRLDLWETSADFPYTSYGQFVREIVPVQIVDTNIEDLRYWLEQSDYDPIEWDDPVELASFAEPCNLKEAFFAVNCQIDSKGVKEKMLSFDEKIKRCDILEAKRKKYN